MKEQESLICDEELLKAIETYFKDKKSKKAKKDRHFRKKIKTKKEERWK